MQIVSSSFSNMSLKFGYSSHSQKTSFAGIDVSKYQKDIDWEAVAADGIEFAMLRMGSRGYGSGRCVIDENFFENMDGCSANSIKVGLYFYSQAVSAEEAREEAQYCVGAAQGYVVEFPLVYYNEEILNDTSRTEDLTRQELSGIAEAFCDTVAGYGFTPMIAGTKKQFATRLDLSTLEDYDKWLLDTDPISEFPYRYSMWQYDRQGSVKGVEGPVNMDLCFVDYSIR